MNSINYLILGGAPKAGTTSLFRYLIDHPQVCGSNRKETYFFARDYDFKNVCKIGRTLQDFESYFSHSTGQERVRLESTPYTLYQTGAAEEIKQLLPSARLIFILREPVGRMISDYHMVYGRKMDASTPTLEEVVDKQFGLWNKVVTNLQQGCYIEYLQPFFNVFGQKNIIILFHEHLLQKPLQSMQQLSDQIGVKACFYSTYHFQNYNQTIRLRYKWLNRIILKMEPVVADFFASLLVKPGIYRIARTSMDTAKSIIFNFTKQTDKYPVSKDVIVRLKNYYQPYNQRLRQELGCPIPWDL